MLKRARRRLPGHMLRWIGGILFVVGSNSTASVEVTAVMVGFVVPQLPKTGHEAIGLKATEVSLGPKVGPKERNLGAFQCEKCKARFPEKLTHCPKCGHWWVGYNPL